MLVSLQMLLACGASDSTSDDTEATSGDTASAPAEVYGEVWFTSVIVTYDSAADVDSWMSMGMAFAEGSPPWRSWEDGECIATGWSMNDRTEQVSGGVEELFLDADLVVSVPAEWPSGSRFGGRASGDVFPAFDEVDAVAVPAAIDVSLPADVEAGADLPLTWTPSAADRVEVTAAYPADPDYPVGVVCSFLDDGDALVEATWLADIVDQPYWGLSVARIAEFSPTNTPALLRFYSASLLSRGYSDF